MTTDRMAWFRVNMEQAGWTVQEVPAPDRKILEGSDADDAALMVTFNPDRPNARTRFYVLEAQEPGRPIGWHTTKSTLFWHFLKHHTMEGGEGARRSLLNRPRTRSQCSCDKNFYATMRRATGALQQTRERRSAAGEADVESRVYRCESDPRRWHVTRRARWGP